LPNKPYVNSDHQQYIDSCVLMDHPKEVFEKFDHIFLSGYVAGEMDNLRKYGKTEETKFQARRACRYIDENEDKITYLIRETGYDLPEDYDKDNMDNKIISILYKMWKNDNTFIAYSNDILFRQKCKDLGIPYSKFGGKDDISDDSYLGYKEVILSEYELATFYECKTNNWDLLLNEYLLIKDGNGDVVDKLKWTDKGFKSLSYKNTESRYVGKVKPRNLQQELYMDMLQDKETKVKIAQGSYGVGKDYLALANFLSMIDKGIYDKIIWIRNNIEVDGTKPLGFLPGTMTEKLSVYADIISDFMGDKISFEMLLNNGKVELIHPGFLRGRDLRNSIIYCTEAQNMSDSLVKLIVSRISEGSIVFFNGDVKQIDDKIFKRNNGLELMINRFKGHPMFGYVYLDKCERSEIAQMASLLD